MRDGAPGQLDALRGLAVLGIVACHTLDVERHPWAGYGQYGVHLFFVLSGFLITSLLLDARTEAAATGQPVTAAFGPFYVRQALRVVPLYFVVLIAAAAIGVVGVREHLGWDVLFLSNWRIALDGYWGAATHTWAVAISGQFVLLWPLVVLVAPRRALPWAVGAMVVGAVVCRAVLLAGTDMWIDGVEIVTPAVGDTLGLGALLAILWRSSRDVERIVTWFGVAGGVLFAADLAVARWAPERSALDAVTTLWCSLLFVWIVHHVARGVRGPLRRALTWRPLTLLGRISFGVYLFHLLVVPTAQIVARESGIDLPIPSTLGVGHFAYVAVVSIAAATITWTALERPILARCDAIGRRPAGTASGAQRERTRSAASAGPPHRPDEQEAMGARMHERRFGQLDALRAFAVLGVVACHTFDPERDPWADYGAYGVQLFFVISGFLITGILMDARRDADAAALPIGGVFRSFYARRALRIFPVYYVTLAVGTLIGVQGLREHLGWNLLYLSNWKIASDGHWGTVTHIWSLAVEEQFYLVWPLVVLLAARRLLPWAIGSMVVVALVTRTVLTAGTDMWADGITILTPAVFDSLGLGALLAFLYRRFQVPAVDRIVEWLGVLAVAVLALQLTADRVGWLPDLRPVTEVWWPLLFVWVVHRTARGVGGPIGQVLGWRWLAYIGTVSYGIYLFHLFVVPVAEIVERRLEVDLPIPDPGITRFVVVGAISILAAAVSWTLFERPINDQKRRFPYVRTTTSAEPASATSLPVGQPPEAIVP